MASGGPWVDQAERRNIIMRVKPGSITLTPGRVDFVRTDPDGRVIQDTRRDRTSTQRSELDDLSAKAARSPVLQYLLSSFSAAMCEPAVEFVRLYDVRDGLSSFYGSDEVAKRALEIGRKDWSEFGRLANDEPILEGRHNGKHADSLRPARPDERATMRRLAQAWIRKFAAAI